MQTNNSHKSQGKPRIHVRITPDNSMDANEIPVSVPRDFLSPADIKAKEAEGRTIIFVVKRIQKNSDGRLSTELKPIRDSARNYLVIVCW